MLLSFCAKRFERGYSIVFLLSGFLLPVRRENRSGLDGRREKSVSFVLLRCRRSLKIENCGFSCSVGSTGGECSRVKFGGRVI